MVEAIIGLTVAILSIVAHYFTYRQSGAGRKQQENIDVEKRIQELRKALESGDPAAIIAVQHDRVLAALRSYKGRRDSTGGKGDP